MAEKQCWSSGVVVALLLALAGAVEGAGSVTGVADANVFPGMVTLESRLIGTMSSRPPGPRALRSRSLATASVWCVAKSNLSDAMLQGALDWVCGPLPSQGQVNCFAVQSGNNCFLPDSVQWHASWAFNVYFQTHNATNDACDFQGTATQVYVDPSTATCVFTGSTQEVNATISNGTMTPPPPGYTILPGRSAASAGYEPELLSHLLAAAAAVVLLMAQLLT